jgi:hypothetical protein
VQSGQNTWSNGKSELLVRVPAQLGSSLSDYLAEFLGFARLRLIELVYLPFPPVVGIEPVAVAFAQFVSSQGDTLTLEQPDGS